MFGSPRLLLVRHIGPLLFFFLELNGELSVLEYLVLAKISFL